MCPRCSALLCDHHHLLYDKISIRCLSGPWNASWKSQSLFWGNIGRSAGWCPHQNPHLQSHQSSVRQPMVSLSARLQSFTVPEQLRFDQLCSLEWESIASAYYCWPTMLSNGSDLSPHYLFFSRLQQQLACWNCLRLDVDDPLYQRLSQKWSVNCLIHGLSGQRQQYHASCL